MGFDAERDAARIGDDLHRFSMRVYPRDIPRLRGRVDFPVEFGRIFGADRYSDRNALQIRESTIGRKIPCKARILRGLPHLRIYRHRSKAEISDKPRKRQAEAKEDFLHAQPAPRLSGLIHAVPNQIIDHAWVR